MNHERRRTHKRARKIIMNSIYTRDYFYALHIVKMLNCDNACERKIKRCIDDNFKSYIEFDMFFDDEINHLLTLL